MKSYGLFCMILSASAALLAADMSVLPTSLVAHDGRQRADISLVLDADAANARLEVSSGGVPLFVEKVGDLKKGENTLQTLIPAREESVDSLWRIIGGDGKVAAQSSIRWSPPRKWTFYLLASTHTDMGLHEAHYIQRRLSSDCIKAAGELAVKTADNPFDTRYRYVMEGFWVWDCFTRDFGEKAARDYIKKFIDGGSVDVGVTCAGNHISLYGFEELCRSIYTKRDLEKNWGIYRDSMIMTDVPGISWTAVVPYSEAGVRNVLFCPNPWGPHDSTIFKKRIHCGDVMTGFGSRIDLRYDSPLPMLFYWLGSDDKSKILVWANPNYCMRPEEFGIGVSGKPMKSFAASENRVAKHCAKMERRYPYDIWLYVRYADNAKPDLLNVDFAQKWNEKWAYPHFKTVGDLSEPFNAVREKYGDKIPTLRGDITNTWALMSAGTPELLSAKLAADRKLASAEKLAAIAAILNPRYDYPKNEIERAWRALMYNDEHSYGFSGYKGRRVYETWIQHSDWITSAGESADDVANSGMAALASEVKCGAESLLIFNPALFARKEMVEVEKGGKTIKFLTPEIPSFGYLSVPISEVKDCSGVVESEKPAAAPTVENSFYKISFAPDGSLKSVFDKALKLELIDQDAKYKCNQFVFTKNNHESMSTPPPAKFEILRDALATRVIARVDDPESGAAIMQETRLSNVEKRIDFDNRLLHVSAIYNNHRHNCYGYFAFPFKLKAPATFRAMLNGCIAIPQKDITGHGSDAFFNARDWVSVENPDCGVALIQRDSSAIEFGQIHPDKTTFGGQYPSDGLYSYVFNDGLQAQIAGGDDVNLRFRYAITSYAGDYKSAKISQFANRVVSPVISKVISANESGRLPSKKSFMSCEDSDIALLALKMSAEIGGGFIARFHETDGFPNLTANILMPFAQNARITKTNIIEDGNASVADGFGIGKFGYLTLRLKFGEGLPPLPPTLKLDSASDNYAKLKFADGTASKKFAVFRGDFPEFMADEFHLLGIADGGEFVDNGVFGGNTYYYKVRAITPENIAGYPSEFLKVSPPENENSAPAKIGSAYTGLLTSPRASRGELNGQLYILWGRSCEPDLSHYELYRSDKSGFVPSKENLIAEVKQEPQYAVGRYVDLNLGDYKTYYYRVCAVDKNGRKGKFSDEFFGTTRQILPDDKKPENKK